MTSVAVASMLFAPVITASSTSSFAKVPPASRAYPAARSADARDLQTELDRQKCFGNLVKAQDKTDRNFGTLSRKALWVFIETYLERNGITGNIPFTNAQLAITILKSPEVRNAEPYCEGSHFLAEWFEDRNTEHLENDTRSADGKKGVCNKDDVGKRYLAKLTGKKKFWANRLTKPLDFTVNNFSSIFADGTLNYKSGMDEDAKKRLETWNNSGVTYESTRKAVEDAAYHFSRLIFAHGISTFPECQVCYRLNDWTYLRNIGQANGGYLIGVKKIVASDGTVRVGRGRASVSSITLEMMEKIESNIKVYRGLTFEMNKQLDSLFLNPTQAKNKRFSLLTEARQNELARIVSELKKIQSTSTGDKKLMKSLHNDYQCDGFDGSSVDQ